MACLLALSQPTQQKSSLKVTGNCYPHLVDKIVMHLCFEGIGAFSPSSTCLHFACRSSEHYFIFHFNFKLRTFFKERKDFRRRHDVQVSLLFLLKLMKVCVWKKRETFLDGYTTRFLNLLLKFFAGRLYFNLPLHLSLTFFRYLRRHEI